jgi:signal peptidase I
MALTASDQSSADNLVGVDGPPSRPARRSALERFVRDWGVVLVVALSVAFVVRVFIFSRFFIPSISMEPTLQVDDNILVNKLSYRVHPVHRGDVVVFDRPATGTFSSDIKDLVKRVIATPGDTVEIRDCGVYLNGARLVEPYVAKDDSGAATCTTAFTDVIDPDGDGKVLVPAGDVLVMGDNRQHSYDGRFWGFLDQRLIVGRAFVIVWPFGHSTWL